MKFVAEKRKFVAEKMKLVAEKMKLVAENMKCVHDMKYGRPTKPSTGKRSCKM